MVGESVPEYTGQWSRFHFHMNVSFIFPHPILALLVHAYVNSSQSCCPSPYSWAGSSEYCRIRRKGDKKLLKAYILPLNMAQELYTMA